MVFSPTPMRRLYLAVPVEYEDQVITKIGEIGTVQLIKEFQVKRTEKSKIIEISAQFERLNEKLDALLSNETKDKAILPKIEIHREVTCEETEDFLAKAEVELNDLTRTMEKLEKEAKESVAVQEKLRFLAASGLKTDEVGTFRHIFVKIGFMRSSLTARLAAYISGTSVISVILPGRTRESLIILAGLNDDRNFAEETLKLFNFEEIGLPPSLNSDPKIALAEEMEKTLDKENQIKETKARMLKLKAETSSLADCVHESLKYEEAKELVIRTKRRSLIHGWIPSKDIADFKTQIEKVVPNEDIYLRTEEPKPEDSVPVQFTNRGVLKAFEVLTSLQGVPNYFEVNPTPIYTLLYVLMFGMMFGDIGSGIVLILLGIIITRLRRGLFAFSLNATKQIAYIMISCGFVTIVFGFLYGIFFLVRTPLPNLISPLNNIEEIIAIALAFGVAQIIVSLTLNIVNMIRTKEPLKVVFGERGFVGLTLYLSGVVAAYAFIRQKDFSAFFQGDTAIFSSIAIVSLALIFLSPLIESLLRRENPSISRKLLEGFGVGLESFIAFIANSVSYIRLAAFAIAHEAISIAAAVLGLVLGGLASLVLLNTLDFAVEGFASFIQSLRLMYYEFSTRFFLKTGISYEPFKLGKVRMKI